MTANRLAAEHDKLLETAAERDQLREVNADLLAALEYITSNSENMRDNHMAYPKGIAKARAAIEKARKEG